MLSPVYRLKIVTTQVILFFRKIFITPPLRLTQETALMLVKPIVANNATKEFTRFVVIIANFVTGLPIALTALFFTIAGIVRIVSVALIYGTKNAIFLPND